MSAPLGVMIGNALEMREAIDVLRGGGPEDTIRLTVELGAEMLLLGREETKRQVARSRIRRVLSDGSGLDVFRRMVEAHGGDPRAVDDPSLLPHARCRVPVLAEASGFVAGIDALALGLLGVEMGAGRVRADQSVDPAVGIELARARGHRIEKGEPLAFLHVHHDQPLAWVGATRAAFRITRARPNVPKSVLLRLPGHAP